MSRSPIASEVDVSADGKQLGYLRLPHSVHRSAYGWLPIPIASIRNGEGPRVVLMAGNHGDEYEGQVILSKLIRELDPGDLRGGLVILPMANYPAAEAGLRTSPIDDGNLNRSFPGEPHGTPTRAIAHYIESVLLGDADYLIDLHSGGSSLDYLPAMLTSWEEGDPDNARRKALLEAFGLPHALLLDRDVEATYSSSAAARFFNDTATTEIGGAGRVTPAYLALAERGLLRALAATGVYRGAVEAEREPLPTRYLEVRPEHYVHAPEGGIFEPLAELGDQVEAGQAAALIHHPQTPGRAPTPVGFGAEGLVLCKRVPALTMRGDCLFHLAVERPPPT
jgi:predicted deacylase